jgi:hypothetical protein
MKFGFLLTYLLSSSSDSTSINLSYLKMHIHVHTRWSQYRYAGELQIENG